jgi:hypothetical protein
MSDAVRLCKDCRWIRPGAAIEYARCGHPSSVWRQAPDLITSEAPLPIALSCYFVRNLPVVPDPCGPEGKHWEPATPLGFV